MLPLQSHDLVAAIHTHHRRAAPKLHHIAKCKPCHSTRSAPIDICETHARSRSRPCIVVDLHVRPTQGTPPESATTLLRLIGFDTHRARIDLRQKLAPGSRKPSSARIREHLTQRRSLSVMQVDPRVVQTVQARCINARQHLAEPLPAEQRLRADVRERAVGEGVAAVAARAVLRSEDRLTRNRRRCETAVRIPRRTARGVRGDERRHVGGQRVEFTAESRFSTRRRRMLRGELLR